MRDEIMISLCDKSGIMCEPWAEDGYTCYAVDLQHKVRKDIIRGYEGGGRVVFTYGDARYWTPPVNRKKVFVSCFPVCTDLAGSGSQDYSNAQGRVPKKGIPQLMDGLMLFNSCFQIASWSGAPFVIENPSGVIPTHFRKSDYTFQPWWFGEDYTKLTCLWTGNGFKMPKRIFEEKPTHITEKIWLMSPGQDRADKRSETPRSFAKAIYEANKPL